MVKLFKIHKYSGLFAGVVLLILGFTGFFLDHKNFSFLYDITFDSLPAHLEKKEKKLVEAYWIDPNDSDHIVVGSRRGIYEKRNSVFVQTLDKQCFALRSNSEGLFAATNEGIYKYVSDRWEAFALEGEVITSLALHDKRILAAVDKKELVVLDTTSASTIERSEVLINEEQLHEDVKLSRFVRDLHYGRGLFDGDLSLLLNDYGAIILSLLALSGYIIWFLIRKKQGKMAKKIIRLHANIFVIFAIFPFFILLVTGIFLDHSKLLANFMRSVTLSHSILPPIYSSLKEDVWSVDMDATTYRIGNRYGVYESSDLSDWKLINQGFSYRMKRLDDTLYVSGMGAPNRMMQGSDWKVLPKTPHMFKDINMLDGQVEFLSMKSQHELPTFEGVSLYTLLLSLHDGSFFASWWVWVNDIAAILLLVLSVTGSIRYIKKKKFSLGRFLPRVKS